MASVKNGTAPRTTQNAEGGNTESMGSGGANGGIDSEGLSDLPGTKPDGWSCNI